MKRNAPRAQLNIVLNSESRDRLVFSHARLSLLHSGVCLVAILLFASHSLAQESHPTEFQVEAAYLYNFGKFVSWPAERTASGLFEICVLGKDPFGEILDRTVSGESIDGKNISVRRISTTQQASSCSILFVSPSEESHLGAVLEFAQRYSLLTVSSIKRFAERGGDIGLVVQQDRVRFEVNRSEAEKCHLVLSSELLKVAVKVIDKGGTGK
jgi:hypothetical protein